jgi:hypothetical protein
MLLKLILLKLSRYIYQKLHHFKNFKKNKFYNYFHLFWILLIGSNHGRRYTLYLKNKKMFNSIVDIKFFKKTNNKNIIIFLGDSHAEFYGKNFKSNKKKNRLFLSVWLGPALLTNFSKSAYSINRSVFFLNKIFNKFGKSNKYHIILSFGEIDIRTAFYQFLKTYKTFENLDDLLKDTIQSLNQSIFLIKEKLSPEYDVKFYFKEPTPTTNMNGQEVKNKSDMNKLIITSNNFLPVLGTLSERIEWHKSLVEKLRLNTKSYEFLKISKDHYNDIGSINRNFSDDHHIVKNKLIIEFQNSLKKII